MHCDSTIGSMQGLTTRAVSLFVDGQTQECQALGDTSANDITVFANTGREDQGI
jgi:hypothetical protein